MTRLEIVIDIDEEITRALSDNRIVGTVVLIARDGEVEYQHAAGYADRESGKEMRVDSLFRLASVTKAIVCATAMALIECDELSLESRVDQWLPGFRLTLPSGESPAITIRHCSRTRPAWTIVFSSRRMDRMPSDDSDGFDQPGLSLQENVRRIASAPLVNQPGVAWQLFRRHRRARRGHGASGREAVAGNRRRTNPRVPSR